MPTISAINVFPVAAPPTGFGGDARNIAQGGPTYANVVLEIATGQPGLKGTHGRPGCAHLPAHGWYWFV